MKNLLKKIYPLFVDIKRINYLKTIYLNFRTQPLSIAIRFPIVIYGKLVIPKLRGKILIKGPIKKGMIKIGYKYLDLVPSSYLPSQIYLLNGTIIFNGNLVTSGGVSLFSSNSTIDIGEFVVIGGGSVVKSLESITIGDNTRIAYESVIFDSNVHFVKNIVTGKIAKNKAPIVIGRNCWINSRSFIGKGTIVPNYSVVAGSSFLNREYSEYGENLFLVGSPAKPANVKVQRIFSSREETKLNNYFNNNPNIEHYNGNEGLFDDENEFFFK